MWKSYFRENISYIVPSLCGRIICVISSFIFFYWRLRSRYIHVCRLNSHICNNEWQFCFAETTLRLFPQSNTTNRLSSAQQIYRIRIGCDGRIQQYIVSGSFSGRSIMREFSAQLLHICFYIAQYIIVWLGSEVMWWHWSLTCLQRLHDRLKMIHVYM